MADYIPSLKDLFKKAGRAVEEAVPEDSAFNKIGAPSTTPEIKRSSNQSISDQIINAYGKDFGNPYAGLEKAKDAASQVGANLANRLLTGNIKKDASAEDVGMAVAKNYNMDPSVQKYAGMAASAVPSIVSMIAGSPAAAVAKAEKGFGKVIVKNEPEIANSIGKVIRTGQEIPASEAAMKIRAFAERAASKGISQSTIMEAINENPEALKKVTDSGISGAAIRGIKTTLFNSKLPEVKDLLKKTATRFQQNK